MSSSTTYTGRPAANSHSMSGHLNSTVFAITGAFGRESSMPRPTWGLLGGGFAFVLRLIGPLSAAHQGHLRSTNLYLSDSSPLFRLRRTRTASARRFGV